MFFCQRCHRACNCLHCLADKKRHFHVGVYIVHMVCIVPSGLKGSEFNTMHESIRKCMYRAPRAVPFDRPFPPRPWVNPPPPNMVMMRRLINKCVCVCNRMEDFHCNRVEDRLCNIFSTQRAAAANCNLLVKVGYMYPFPNSTIYLSNLTLF